MGLLCLTGDRHPGRGSLEFSREICSDLLMLVAALNGTFFHQSPPPEAAAATATTTNIFIIDPEGRGASQPTRTSLRRALLRSDSTAP
jgi:hypothetical protein